jgi:large subunit ribosomal protein L25
VAENSLVAEPRAETGKGVARKLRVAGRIPGVLYGRGREARPLTVDPRALERVLHESGAGMNTLVELRVGGDAMTVLVKEIQRDPVRGSYLHADFFALDLTQKVDVQVPIHFVGKAHGVEMGGVVDHPLRELELECLPRAIPEFIEVDVSHLDIGDSIHVRELTLPEGVELKTDPELAVAICNAPRAEEELEAAPEEEAAAAAEVAPAEGAEESETSD